MDVYKVSLGIKLKIQEVKGWIFRRIDVRLVTAEHDHGTGFSGEGMDVGHSLIPLERGQPGHFHVRIPFAILFPGAALTGVYGAVYNHATRFQGELLFLDNGSGFRGDFRKHQPVCPILIVIRHRPGLMGVSCSGPLNKQVAAAGLDGVENCLALFQSGFLGSDFLGRGFCYHGNPIYGHGFQEIFGTYAGNLIQIEPHVINLVAGNKERVQLPQGIRVAVPENFGLRVPVGGAAGHIGDGAAQFRFFQLHQIRGYKRRVIPPINAAYGLFFLEQHQAVLSVFCLKALGQHHGQYAVLQGIPLCRNARIRTGIDGIPLFFGVHGTGHQDSGTHQKTKQADPDLGLLPFCHIQNPSFRITLTKGQGRNGNALFVGGQPQQGGGIIPPDLGAQLPDHRFITTHFHVFPRQHERHPHQRIKPVDTQGAVGQKLPDVVKAADMVPLMGKNIRQLLAGEIGGQIDFGPEYSQNKGGADMVGPIDAPFQGYRIHQLFPEPEILPQAGKP